VPYSGVRVIRVRPSLRAASSVTGSWSFTTVPSGRGLEPRNRVQPGLAALDEVNAAMDGYLDHKEPGHNAHGGGQAMPTPADAPHAS
jgi:hypothetical protein